jgi:small subunit ribosomal protein S1
MFPPDISFLVYLLHQIFLPAFASFGGFAFIIVIIYLLYPEKVERAKILIDKALAYVSEKHERRYISKSIEHNINSNIEKFDRESEGILPYKIRVEWVDVDSIESYLRENALIIKMKNHRNQSKNFALAVREYVPRALIPTARRYVHKELMKAIDYVVSKNILAVDPNALNYFIDVTAREVDKIKEPVKEIEEINRRGHATRILLSEYKKLSYLYPSEPKPDIHEETKNFELKVYRLATKKPEEKVDTTYLGKYIKAAVVPIAKIETLEDFGLEAHMKFIREALEKGINTFYIVAAGEINTSFAKQLLEETQERYKLRKIYEDEYRGIHRERKMKMFVGILTTSGEY